MLAESMSIFKTLKILIIIFFHIVILIGHKIQISETDPTYLRVNCEIVTPWTCTERRMTQFTVFDVFFFFSFSLRNFPKSMLANYKNKSA